MERVAERHSWTVMGRETKIQQTSQPEKQEDGDRHTEYADGREPGFSCWSVFLVVVVVVFFLPSPFQIDVDLVMAWLHLDFRVKKFVHAGLCVHLQSVSLVKIVPSCRVERTSLDTLAPPCPCPMLGGLPRSLLPFPFVLHALSAQRSNKEIKIQQYNNTKPS